MKTSDRTRAELKALENLPDSAIDTSDIPERTAYPGAPSLKHDPHVVGKMAAHIVLPWVHRIFEMTLGAPEKAYQAQFLGQTSAADTAAQSSKE